MNKSWRYLVIGCILVAGLSLFIPDKFWACFGAAVVSGIWGRMTLVFWGDE